MTEKFPRPTCGRCLNWRRITEGVDRGECIAYPPTPVAMPSEIVGVRIVNRRPVLDADEEGCRRGFNPIPTPGTKLPKPPTTSSTPKRSRRRP